MGAMRRPGEPSRPWSDVPSRQTLAPMGRCALPKILAPMGRSYGVRWRA